MNINKTRVSIDKEHSVKAIKNIFLMVFLSLHSFCVKQCPGYRADTTSNERFCFRQSGLLK